MKIVPTLPSAINVCHSSVDLARAAQTTANGARKQFWSQLNSAVRSSGINVKQDVVLYDLGGRASFTYNAYTGTAWYEVTLPKGVKIEEGKVKSSLDGSYSIPNVDPMVVFNELGFVRTRLVNKYSSWVARRSTGQDRHIYLSSKRFVDTVSIENASQEVFWAVVTAGQTAKGTIESLKEQLILEWGDILSWLREVGAENHEEIAAAVAKAILENGLQAAFIPLKLPGKADLDVRVDVELIDYEYEIRPAVTGEMKKLLSLVGINSDKALAGAGSKVRIPHVGFSLSIKRPRSAKSYSQEFKDFAGYLQNGPSIDIGNLGDQLSNVVGLDLGKARQFKDAGPQGSVREAFSKTFSGVLSDFEKYHKGEGLFDFTESRFAKDVQKKLDGLMIGNAKAAQVRKLTVDVTSATITLEVDLKSKHRLLQIDVLRQLDKAWTAKDEAESKAFNTVFGKARSACDKLAEICRSLPTGTSQDCRRSEEYKSLTLEPLSKPIDQSVAIYDTASLASEAPPIGDPISRYDLSVADPALPLTNTPVLPSKGSKSLASVRGSCNGIFVGRRYILTSGCYPRDDDTDIMNIDSLRVEGPFRNPVSKMPIESLNRFNIFESALDDSDERGAASLAYTVPRVGERLFIVSIDGASVTKGCWIGPNVNESSLDIRCPPRLLLEGMPPSTMWARGWVFSQESRRLLGYVASDSGDALVKTVNESPLLLALSREEPIYRAPRSMRGFVPLRSGASRDSLSASVANATMFLTGTLYGRSNEAKCVAVRISQTKVLVPGCPEVDVEWLRFNRKRLQDHRFELVIGSTIQSGRRVRTASTGFSNGPDALLLNATLDDSVEIAELTARQPTIDEPVVLVRAAPWEKSVRTDCVISSSPRKEDAFGVTCNDGPYPIRESGMLVFSATDGALLGFGGGRSAVATMAILATIRRGLADAK